MDWDISKAERKALRDVSHHPGWKIYLAKLNELEDDARHYLEAADNEAEWRKARGFLNGVRQVKDLLNNLISVAEEGGQERWLKKELERMQVETEELEAMLLVDSRERRGAPLL